MKKYDLHYTEQAHGTRFDGITETIDGRYYDVGEVDKQMAFNKERLFILTVRLANIQKILGG